MKRIFTAFCYAALAMPLMAQTETDSTQCEKQDTMKIVRPENVTLITAGDKFKVEVQGQENDSSFVYTKEMSVQTDRPVITTERTKDWDFGLDFLNTNRTPTSSVNLIMSGICIGWNTALDAPDGMDVDMGESYEIMWPYILGWQTMSKNRKFDFTVGVGVNWKNFRMTGRTRFIKDGDNIMLGGYPDGADIEFSRLKVFSWIVPLTVTYRIDRNMRFTFGPVINFNTYASLKTRYKVDGEKHKDFSKRLKHASTTVDLLARLRYRGLGVYVKYSPCNVLKSDWGPQFSGLSTGISIAY